MGHPTGLEGVLSCGPAMGPLLGGDPESMSAGAPTGPGGKSYQANGWGVWFRGEGGELRVAAGSPVDLACAQDRTLPRVTGCPNGERAKITRPRLRFGAE